MSGQEGPGFETASWPRRMLALVIDSFASSLVVGFFMPELYEETGGVANLVVIGVLVLESAVFTWLLAGSFGKLVTGLRVIPAQGRWRPINPVTLLIRQVLVALVIPPLVFRPDGRGLHDMFAGTATVTKATYASLIRS
ncbi:RDD family protein [Nocardioides sp.]|uniref:RDD family protein n=1 Tax=Nocardioides sp. TaxID=35761 RepID=UPI002388A0FD|nr:RDD family protein [Nocardioides sp.]MDE0776681.1 RDD family protein [Nocardioides sp.]